MTTDTAKIERIPGLKDLLDKCYDDIATLTGKRVSVTFNIKFKEVTADHLRHIICRVCEVSWEDILTGPRKGSIIIARQLFCWFAMNVAGITCTETARILNKNHATILVSRDKVQNMIDTDDELYMVYFKPVNEAVNKLM